MWQDHGQRKSNLSELMDPGPGKEGEWNQARQPSEKSQEMLKLSESIPSSLVEGRPAKTSLAMKEQVAL
jgi:hypothetical protein